MAKTKDTPINQIIINKLSKAQYEGIETKDPSQLYFVTDEDKYLTEVVTDASLSGKGTAEDPLKALPALPDQTDNAGKLLTTDGENASWIEVKVPPQIISFQFDSNKSVSAGIKGNTENKYYLAAYNINTNSIESYGGRYNNTLDFTFYQISGSSLFTGAILTEQDSFDGYASVEPALIASEISNLSPDAKSGTTGQVYTKTDEGAEWKDVREGIAQVLTIADFSEPVAEDLNKLVLYVGPTVDADEVSIQKIFDSKIINGHVFGVIEQTIVISETESQTFYMWKDVYENLPVVSDETNNKVLSNDGLNMMWVNVPSTTEIIMREL